MKLQHKMKEEEDLEEGWVVNGGRCHAKQQEELIFRGYQYK